MSFIIDSDGKIRIAGLCSVYSDITEAAGSG